MEPPLQSDSRTARERGLRLALVAVLVLYAFLAALRTVGDFDAGWQMAVGRYVVEHRAIPATDVLSYTAQGQSWIYPPFAGVLLYLVFAKLGWAGLSWVCALVAALVVGMVTRRADLATAVIAANAIKIIADRATPRGDLFTLLLFPLFLLTLLRARDDEQAPLWPLPLMMLLWVNLHPGFVLGLALLAWFVLAEAVDRRWARLYTRWPWLVACLVSTLVNPWGPKIYLALARQQAAMKLHAAFIGEWSPTPISWESILASTGPMQSVLKVMVCIGLLGIVLALRRRAFMEALLLAVAVYGSLEYIRLQALCAVVIVVVAGRSCDEWYRSLVAPGDRKTTGRSVRALLVGVTILLSVIGTVSVTSNMFYVTASSTSEFGAGESWWFPERAARFIERERLPRQLFHEYNVGGFVALRLGPAYPDYIDGRAIPFGPKLFVEQALLLAQPPDSARWTSEADRRGINVLWFSLARFGGLGSVDVAGFCRSQNWRPVYLDEVSMVLLRNLPQNRPWIDRLEIDCAKQSFEPPAGLSKIQQFNFYSNAASVLYVLSRDQEAFADLEKAEALFFYDANLHLTRGQLLQSAGQLPPAEAEFRTALRFKQSDVAWSALCQVLAAEARLKESRDAFRNAAALAVRPQNSYKAVGQLSLALNEPDEALRNFDRAQRASPFHGDAEILGTEFYAQLDQGRAEAMRQKNDLGKAIEFQLRAIARTPQAQKRWVDLARLYDAAGRKPEAAQALERASALARH